MSIKSALQPSTVASILAEGTAILARHGIETARLDAERLAGHFLQTTRLELYKKAAQVLTEGQVYRIRFLFERRAKREPLQQIIGDQEFWGRDFLIAPGVFIPRPETEGLVEEAIAWLDLGWRQGKDGATILDLCTGSGCIAITMALYMHTARLYAIDNSPGALETARANSKRYGVGERIDFFCGNLFEPLKALRLGKRIDLILSNPPYIPTSLIRTLQPEVSLYEPWEALDGGMDGLEFVRKIILQAPPYLSSRGRLIIEIGDRQAAPLAQWFQKKFPNARLEFRLDLAGIQRVACIDFSRRAGIPDRDNVKHG